VPFTREFAVPKLLATDAFVLRPITAADAELDHAAVMESREYLRTWEQSTWPEDGFTVEQNRLDLEKLEKWNAERMAFTYTVRDPAEAVCLGCVYIFPTNASVFQKARISPVGPDRWDDYEAAVYFWVRKSQLEAGKDRMLLGTLREWLSTEWGLLGHVFVTNEQFEQQVRLIEGTDLGLRFAIEEQGKPGKYLAYS
jgi:hypothetical protein